MNVGPTAKSTPGRHSAIKTQSLAVELAILMFAIGPRTALDPLASTLPLFTGCRLWRRQEIDAMIRMAKSFESNEGFETPNYSVSYHRANSDRLIIVFISAGRMGPGGPIEEFKKSLTTMQVSTMFVRDKHIRWFNYHDTLIVFDRIAAIAEEYSHVGAMGESMGGSGALLASEHIPVISRVLSLSPQYSISMPFINFDSRYEPIARTIPHHFFAGFSGTKSRDECVLVYGNTDWKDFLHSSGFMGEGFTTVFIDHAPHSVAGFLKNSAKGNRLIQMLSAFCDFANPFNGILVSTLLSDLLAKQWIRTGYAFAEEFGRNRTVLKALNDKYAAEMGEDIGPNQCIGKTATQSSVGPWSRFQDLAKEASGAISGEVNGFYSFHTNLEMHPWWMVDLAETYDLKEVRIFNYIAEAALAERASKFVLEVSIDAQTWYLMHERVEQTPFGGSDGNPFLWRPDRKVLARYVRVRLTIETWLHLDQVEIYGKPVLLNEEALSLALPEKGLD